MPTQSSQMRPNAKSTMSMVPWGSTCPSSLEKRVSNTTSSCQSGGSRLRSCAVPFSPVAAAVAAAVSAVESANHQRRMTTTNTWTQKTWRPRSKQSRMEEEWGGDLEELHQGREAHISLFGSSPVPTSTPQSPRISQPASPCTTPRNEPPLPGPGHQVEGVLLMDSKAPDIIC